MERDTTRMDDVYDDDDDRISQLPEAIVHHILCFLKDSPKELVRMSVLSKDWFAKTAAFPVLNFNFDTFNRNINASRSLYDVKDMFFKYVEYTTSRFCNQQNNVTSVHTFNLNGPVLLDNPSQLSIAGRCIRLILRKGGLQVFHVDMDTVSPLPKYRFPHILLSVSSLSSLFIHDCELPSSMMVDDAIKFKSLKRLILIRVNINEQVIKRLTTNCPLLEILMLVKCHGFKRFCINGLQNLLLLSLNFNNEVEKIDIDAPNLRCLVLLDQYQRGEPCMNLSSCKKLKALTYCGKLLPKLEGSVDFLSNFPYIENLWLATSQDNLRLSSHSLKTLVLSPCCNWEVTDIKTPNLVLFKYTFFSLVYEPLVISFAKSEAQMEWFPMSSDASKFKDLRRFLNKTNGFFKVLKLNICSRFIDVEELKVIDSPPFELEHVEVELGIIKDLPVYVAAVDAVLWCLRPRSLTLKSDFHILEFEQRRHIVKFICDKLLQQEDEGRTRIWIEFSVSSLKPKQDFKDLNSFLAALPHDPPRHIITFTKVEDSNAEGPAVSRQV